MSGPRRRYNLLIVGASHVRRPQEPREMTRRKRWLIHGGIVCVIVVAQVILLWMITSPYPDVRQPPAETNRIVHPAGFSIIKPGRTCQ